MNFNIILAFMFWGIGIFCWVLSYISQCNIKKVPATRRQTGDIAFLTVSSLVYAIYSAIFYGTAIMLCLSAI